MNVQKTDFSQVEVPTEGTQEPENTQAQEALAFVETLKKVYDLETLLRCSMALNTLQSSYMRQLKGDGISPSDETLAGIDHLKVLIKQIRG